MSIFFPLGGGQIPAPHLPARIEVALSADPQMAAGLHGSIPARIEVALSAAPTLSADLHGEHHARIEVALSADPTLAAGLKTRVRLLIALSAAPALSPALHARITRRVQVALAAAPAISVAIHGGHAQRVEVALSANPSLTVTVSGGVEVGTRIVVALNASPRLSVTVRSESTYVPAITSRDTEAFAIFVVDDVEIPFIRARHIGADGFAAAALSVTLAIMDLDQIPDDANCHLNYVIDGVEKRRFTGRVAGWRHAQGLDGEEIADEIEVVCAGFLADRSALAPKALTVLYDPSRVSADELVFDQSALPTDYDTGLPIQPVLVPFTGMSAYDVLDYCGEKMGYEIIRRFEDYPVDRVDISPRDGWYAGVNEVLTGIDTLRAVDDYVNTIKIDDVDRPVWTGQIVRQVTLSDMLPTITRSSAEIVNVLEMDYDPLANSSADDTYYEYITRPVETPFPQDGVLHQTGYEYVRLTRSRVDDSILNEDVLYSDTQTFNEDNVMILRVRIQQTMAGVLKILHIKDVWASVPKQDGSGDMYLEQIRHETYGMSWVIRKNVWSLQATHNRVLGAVAVIEDPDGGPSTMRPLTDAIRMGDVTSFEPYTFETLIFEEEFENYEIVNDHQYNQTVTKLDMLTEQRGAGFTTLQSGQPPSVPIGRKGRKRRTRTIEHAGSIATYGRRKAVSYTAGRRPYRVAKPAAERHLARLTGFLPDASLNMPTPIYDLERSDALEITDVTGNLGIFRVRSFEEDIDETGIAQTIELSKAVE